MRFAVTVGLAVALSTSAMAQSIGLPLSPIGLPLSSIGLPLSPVGIALSPTGLSISHIGLPMSGFDRAPADREHSNTRERHPRPYHRGLPAVVYVVPVVGWDALAAKGTVRPGPAEQRPLLGRLRLELQVDVTPQVYVDGVYAGLLSDFRDGLPLEAGRHSLQLRADGYEPLELDVQVFADRATTYRGLLRAVASSPAPVIDVPARTEAPPSAAPVWMIPGCYLGNVPPQDVKLAVGCDPTRAVRLK